MSYRDRRSGPAAGETLERSRAVTEVVCEALDRRLEELIGAGFEEAEANPAAGPEPKAGLGRHDHARLEPGGRRLPVEAEPDGLSAWRECLDPGREASHADVDQAGLDGAMLVADGPADHGGGPLRGVSRRVATIPVGDTAIAYDGGVHPATVRHRGSLGNHPPA